MKKQHEKYWLIIVLLASAFSFSESAQTKTIKTRTWTTPLKFESKNSTMINDDFIEDSTRSDTIPYDVVEKMPQFPGGEKALQKFFHDRINWGPTPLTTNGPLAKVIIRFTITTSGNVKDIIVLKSLDVGCDKEAVRIAKILSRFIPGEHNGKKVSVRYTFAVLFHPNL